MILPGASHRVFIIFDAVGNDPRVVPKILIKDFRKI